MTENFIFIAAPNGDGSSPKSGVVHVYSYDKENFTVDEVFQILPPLMVPLSSLGKIFWFRGILFLLLPRKLGRWSGLCFQEVGSILLMETCKLHSFRPIFSKSNFAR